MLTEKLQKPGNKLKWKTTHTHTTHAIELKERITERNRNDTRTNDGKMKSERVNEKRFIYLCGFALPIN